MNSFCNTVFVIVMQIKLVVVVFFLYIKLVMLLISCVLIKLTDFLSFLFIVR